MIKVEKKEQIEKIDGLVLTMDEKKEMGFIVDWLLTCQKSPSIFVWVFSAVALEYEEDILLGLGANDVVMTKSRESNLIQVVKNTFVRLEQSNKLRKKKGTYSIINEKNRSVLVNGVEKVLTRKEYQSFLLLYKSKNSVVSYEELLDQLYPNNNKREIYRIANIIFHLREKIKEDDHYTINTVRSKGYILQLKDT